MKAKTKSEFTLADLLPTANDMQLNHPTMGPIEVFINLVSTDSAPFRQKSLALMKKRQTSETPDAEQMVNDNAELTAACITGWSPDSAFGGAYSNALAVELLLKPEFGWIREQIDTFVKERRNFFR